MPRNWLFFKLIPSPSFCRVHHATCCSVGTVHVMHFIICGHSVCIAVGLLQPANIKTDARCANQAFLLNCVTNLSFLLHIFPFLFQFCLLHGTSLVYQERAWYLEHNYLTPKTSRQIRSQVFTHFTTVLIPKTSKTKAWSSTFSVTVMTLKVSLYQWTRNSISNEKTLASMHMWRELKYDMIWSMILSYVVVWFEQPQ